MADPIRCPWCRQRHMPRHLCDPVKAMLDAMIARGDSFTLPTLQFDTPMSAPVDPAHDQLVQQLVVKGAVIGAAGVNHPALMFTGRTLTGVLPQWVYAASDTQLRSAARLVCDMTEAAIRAADTANQQGGPTA